MNQSEFGLETLMQPLPSAGKICNRCQGPTYVPQTFNVYFLVVSSAVYFFTYANLTKYDKYYPGTPYSVKR